MEVFPSAVAAWDPSSLSASQGVVRPVTPHPMVPARYASSGGWSSDGRSCSAVGVTVVASTCLFAIVGRSSQRRRRPLAGRTGVRHVVCARARGAEPELVAIEMKAPLDGKIGVSVQSGTCIVSRLVHEEAFRMGWRLKDVVVELNGEAIGDGESLKAVVKSALEGHRASGTPLRFLVQRVAQPTDTSRGMVRMTPGTGGSLTMPMIDLVRGLTQDFTVVLFLDGTIEQPKGNLSALAVQAVAESEVGFKAVDCSDEQYNPGVRAAVEELIGEYALPQLFVGGSWIGDGHHLEKLHSEGGLHAIVGAPK